ncbi:heat shock 22 kDa protein, mitochondrial-like [Rhododendron vialii]|uniref:heat shock 22 kDa protein, mitochondrial-like n=1 Tax=Rhododendron vialii TaxID=182163 RepID=UPI00265DC276|nr:heat shock 22 kDa protein, mitochondrial-like [Rhododendron vialii]
MASSLALKKLVSSNLLPMSLRAARQAAPASQRASRLFNTNAVREFEEEDDDDRSLADRRRYNVYGLRRSDAFDPFVSTRSLNQILNMVGKLTDLGSGLRPEWDAKETEDGLCLRMDMPGLGKENVKISVEQNALVIKGESEEEPESRRFSSRIDLPEKLYKTDQIKAEMKNGVLKVVLPKVKEEERSDVFHVKVE